MAWSWSQSLGQAIEFGDITAFGFFLERTNNVDVDNFGRRPLCMALWQGNVRMVELLLLRGANPNLCTELSPKHPLFSVNIARNAVDVVRWMLYWGSQIPRSLSPGVQRVVDTCMCWEWTPQNHHTWPAQLRKQVVALLSVFRVQPALLRTQRLLFCCLMQFVAIGHFSPR